MGLKRLNPSELRAVCVSHPYGTAADTSKHKLVLFTSTQQHRNQFCIQSDINFPLRSTALLAIDYDDLIKCVNVLLLTVISLFSIFEIMPSLFG